MGTDFLNDEREVCLTQPAFGLGFVPRRNLETDDDAGDDNQEFKGDSDLVLLAHRQRDPFENERFSFGRFCVGDVIVPR